MEYERGVLRVRINYLSRALKFCPEFGEAIESRIRCNPKKSIEVGRLAIAPRARAKQGVTEADIPTDEDFIGVGSTKVEKVCEAAQHFAVNRCAASVKHANDSTHGI